jgi:hypothetical protein
MDWTTVTGRVPLPSPHLGPALIALATVAVSRLCCSPG